MYLSFIKNILPLPPPFHLIILTNKICHASVI